MVRGRRMGRRLAHARALGMALGALLAMMVVPSALAQTAPRSDADPRIQAIVSAVSEDRLDRKSTRLNSSHT